MDAITGGLNSLSVASTEDGTEINNTLLSDRFFAWLNTEPVKLAREKALLKLDGYFVPMPFRRFMIKIIDHGLDVLFESPSNIEKISSYRKSKLCLLQPGYIAKGSRLEIKSCLEDIVDNNRRTMSNELTWTAEEVAYAFTILGVSKIIEDIFRKVGVHSWRVSGTRHRRILATSDVHQQEFEEAFRKNWSCKDFTAESVLEIISFNRGFLHVNSKVFALTAAHCVPQTLALRVETDSIDAAAVELVDAVDHDSIFCIGDEDESINRIPNHTVFELGTPVYKFGNASGLTLGYLHSLSSSVEFSKTRQRWTDMIEVVWTSGEAFCQGGDSGSLYFARRGCKFIPFAIHRGRGFTHQERAPKNLPYCSMATPLMNAVEELCIVGQIPEDAAAIAYVCQQRHCNDI